MQFEFSPIPDSHKFPCIIIHIQLKQLFLPHMQESGLCCVVVSMLFNYLQDLKPCIMYEVKISNLLHKHIVLLTESQIMYI